MNLCALSCSGCDPTLRTSEPVPRTCLLFESGIFLFAGLLYLRGLFRKSLGSAYLCSCMHFLLTSRLPHEGEEYAVWDDAKQAGWLNVRN